MIEPILYLIIVGLRLSVICGSIRVLKMASYLFNTVPEQNFKWPIFRLLKVNKKYLTLGLLSAVCFTVSQVIEIFQVILDLKHLAIYGERILFHIKDFTFTISCILLIRCMFKILKIEFRFNGL